MELRIKNIGVVAEANIKLSGLTVLAGPNGSGKTTVARVLNVLVESVIYRDAFIEVAIEKEFGDRASELLVSLSKFSGKSRQKLLSSAMKAKVTSFYEDVLYARYDPLVKEINDLLDLSDIMSGDLIRSIVDKFIAGLPEITSNLQSLKKPNDISGPIYAHISEKLAQWFDFFDGFDIGFEIINGDDSILKCNLNEDLGDFFGITSEEFDFFESVVFYEQHASLDKLPNLISGIPIKNSNISDLSNLVAEIIGGQITDVPGTDALALFKDNRNRFFPFSTVASGILAWAPMYKLLVDNQIGENSLLIIDEPENHLHPEWQVKFAKVLTLLVAKGVTVLVSSHSPIFLTALERYSKIHQIEQLSTYYLAEITDGKSIFRDKSDDVDQVLSTLFNPFHRLVWSEDESL